ncbi:MAG: hypothetical protein F2877_04105, partial [Actinobacteria bacterium]|nr:hypothetical protein [Actinomycetota bacterium]
MPNDIDTPQTLNSKKIDRSGAVAAPRALIVLAVSAVVLVGIAQRIFVTSSLWLDEALTVNIARVPIGSLVGTLKVDGAPPLYYLLLHFWMNVFGEGDTAVRALPALLGILSLPLAFFAGKKAIASDGRRARELGWMVLLLVAASPYAIRYSSENRMYVLVIDLVLLGYIFFSSVLVRPSYGSLIGISLVTGALLYTNYWCLYLVVVVGVVTLWRSLKAPADELRTARRILGSIVVGVLLFLPWLPIFEYQRLHTGTPWGTAIAPTVGFAYTIFDFAAFGVSLSEGWPLAGLLLLLALIALFGTVMGDQLIIINIRTVSGARWEWAIGMIALGLGLGVAYASGSAFQTRYAAMCYPFYVLSVGMGLMLIPDRRFRYGFLALAITLGFFSGLVNARTDRTQATQVADVLIRDSRPGDVVGFCPDQLGPATARLLASTKSLGLYAFPDMQSPQLIDWTDYALRNSRSNAEKYARALLAKGGSNDVWFV